jgi:DNA polymerase-3 subunit alpha
MTTEDFLVVKSKEGLEERLEFLFPDEAERKEKRPSMMSVWILNSRLSTRWASRATS